MHLLGLPMRCGHNSHYRFGRSLAADSAALRRGRSIRPRSYVLRVQFAAGNGRYGVVLRPRPLFIDPLGGFLASGIQSWSALFRCFGSVRILHLSAHRRHSHLGSSFLNSPCLLHCFGILFRPRHLSDGQLHTTPACPSFTPHLDNHNGCGQ